MSKHFDPKARRNSNTKAQNTESDTHLGATAGGALSGQAMADAVNPKEEDAFWRENYGKRGYVELDRPYEDYQPAYRYGWEARERMGDRSFREVERDLESGWEKARGSSKLAWREAKEATNDAWQRIKRH